MSTRVTRDHGMVLDFTESETTMTDQTAGTVLLIHALATVMMAGLIWFVQVVHYPLFSRVGPEAFAAYEARHQARTTWVVMPLMLAELVTAVLIAFMTPRGIAPPLAWTALVAVLLIWGSTFFIQVPLHNRLAAAFDADAAAKLVATNWIRTVLWTGRAIVALVFLRNALP